MTFPFIHKKMKKQGKYNLFASQFAIVYHFLGKMRVNTFMLELERSQYFFVGTPTFWKLEGMDSL